ncbi:MAG: carboxypeptidase M32 [Leptospiraceae bacterium]|nr:carboxypeptidase M32 [Leptospiraceae bacterium]MCK6381704.1 carboxypeptidase M32 [Leptospiraceae bacterium]NUM42066.1 carboxypeptidase M32 [Leptospiraceae bacterium]
MTNKLQKYRDYYKKIVKFSEIQSVLHWDYEVMMPKDAAENRSEQISLLAKMHHDMFVSEEFTRLIDDAKNEVIQKNPPDKEILLREFQILKKDRDRALKIPTDLVENFSKQTSISHQVWANARKNNNFKEFEPNLTQIVDLIKEMGELYGYEEERYDSLLEEYETKTTAKDLELLFHSLKKSLVVLIEKSKTYPNPFKKTVSESLQKSFNEILPEYLGLPNSRSRLDISEHPFSTSLGKMDKRITTRYDEANPLSSIFGVLHETGHSLYELGLGEMNDFPTPLTSSVSLGLHESQSRLWENQIGRSREFWEFFYPKMLSRFQLTSKDIDLQGLIDYLHSTEKTKIRVEADGLTYNLHIILRFEIERELISRNLKIKDIPELWNSKMKEYFGLRIENDSEGVLQDVHWSGGAFGYFPTYTLGNIYSAQLFFFFAKNHPNFLGSVSKSGDFSILLNWLKEKIHLQGRIFDPKELIFQATGEFPNSKYLLNYLEYDFLK